MPSAHFLGGPSLHTGTECPECGREVTLTWDLDLKSPEIPAAIRNGFRSLQRLPLYVCSQCSVLSYRIVDDETIACFPHDWHLEWCEEDESPHYEARAEIERQPIHLHVIPPAIDALLRKERALGFDESLNPDEATTLQEYYESLKIDPVDRHYYSQLGGSPYWIQGPQPMACPNKQCDAWQDDEDESDIIAMKRLAHISPPDSPGLGDSIGYFDFQFLACPECFSIRVQYECT
jgi:hypothetical protein